MEIDSYGYKSKLKNIAPAAKIYFAMVPLLAILIKGNFKTSIIAFLIISGFIMSYSTISFKKYLYLLSIPLGFLLIGTITIMISKESSGSKLILGFNFFDSRYGISAESLGLGLVLITKSMASIACMYFINLTTPVNEILDFFRKIKVPSLIIDLMELIYRYIFVILEEGNKMLIAQGAKSSDLNYLQKLRGYGELMGNLLQRSLIRSIRISQALESRGYENQFYYLERKYLTGKKYYLLGSIIGIFLLWI